MKNTEQFYNDTYYVECPYYNQCFYETRTCPYSREQDNESNFSIVRGSNSMEIDFKTDSQGGFHKEIKEYLFGRTIILEGTILSPDAIYGITIKSSGGGGGNFENIRINQVVKFIIKTVIPGKTTITIDIRSDVPNSSGRGKITYYY